MPPRKSSVLHSIDLTVTWRNLNTLPLSSKAKDLTWRIAHQVLPLRTFLYEFGITRLTVCPFCERLPETLEHVLVNCQIVSTLWQHVDKWVEQLLGRPFVVQAMHCIYLCFATELGKINTTLAITTSELINAIWSRRNEIVFDKKRHGTQDIEFLFLHRLRTRIRADFLRLPRADFTRTWNNVFVTINKDKLEILF